MSAPGEWQVTQPHLDLKAPPPLPEGGLRVMALGGLGEIGRNMAVLEFDGQLLVIDCGVLFPEAEQPGIDLILPDFGVIEHRLDDIAAVVLTHGHEDHIGAIPYLLRLRGDIPLVGSRFTLALVEAKLREHRIDPVLVEVAAGDDHLAGPFHCEFISVNHSIPDALAVAVHTPGGRCWCTPATSRWTSCRSTACSPTWARSPDSALDGIDLLLSDSTNAEVPGFVTPERSIGPVLDDVFARATQRLIVSSFASHVHRIQQVLDCADRHGRKVALVGRSMVRNMGVARDLGLLRDRAGADGLPRRRRGDAAGAGRAGQHRVAGRAAVGARAAWPAASTTRSPSRPATPSSSRRRWCRATRPPSTR